MFKIKIFCGLLLLSTFAEAFTNVQNETSTKVTSQRIAEGGSLPQHEKDNLNLNQDRDVNSLNSTFPIIMKKINNTRATNGTNVKVPSDKFTNSGEAKPVIEKPVDIQVVVPKKNDEKQSVGKKEAILSSNDSVIHVPFEESTLLLKITTSSPILLADISTTKPKPLLTKHDAFAVSVKSDPVPETPSILEKKTNRANYVIPIVAVILSVPLVAIIISVLYRRGTDWWQHRNYRRMDFLIEGMYNN